MFLAYLLNVVDYITYKHEQLALSFIHLYLYVYDVNDNMFVKRLLFMKLNYTLLTLCLFDSFIKLCTLFIDRTQKHPMHGIHPLLVLWGM